MKFQLPQKWVPFLVAGGLAIIFAIFLGVFINKKYQTGEKMNSEPTGLKITINEQPNTTTPKTLRCFVNGAFVGQFSLSECAQKNGVAAQALDVGIDDSGELTAAPTASLTPPPSDLVTLPPKETAEIVQNPEIIPEMKPETGPTAPCLRYAGNQWNRLADSLTLNQCVILLYQGRCEKPGSASYGRWDGKTLRLVPKKVEISDDNVNFRLLMRQSPNCTVSPE